MKPKFLVREYKKEDSKDLANAGYAKIFNIAELTSWHGFRGLLKRLIYRLAGKKRKCFVAYSIDDQKTVGIIHLGNISKGIWESWNIFVSPNYRRQGIGTLLYRTCFEYLRKKGAKKLVESVSLDNIASIKSIEKNWDGFLVQKFLYYCGNLPRTQKRKIKGIAERDFKSGDRTVLFNIFKQCAKYDWRSFLEITEETFLDRFIDCISGKGVLRLLYNKRILIMEENKSVKAYAIIVKRRFVKHHVKTATLFMFVSSKVSLQAGNCFLDNIFNNLNEDHVEKILIYTITEREDLLSNILANFNITLQQYLVPIKSL